MTISVLVEPVEGNGYRARSGEPLVLATEGVTPEEALRKLREQIETRLATGAQLVEQTIAPHQEHPAARFRGNWNKDDPAVQRWKQYVEEYRQQIDADPTIP